MKDLIGIARGYQFERPDLLLASGVLLSPDGVVATFGHAPGEGHYTVYLYDGRKLSASILVDDRRTGLRLLKVDSQDLPHLSLAEVEAEVGDQVFATFCTDRHERAATQGMVSARPRGAVWASSLQLDHAVAGPMSTGGPLVDGDGRLVGLLAGKSASGDQPDSGAFGAPLDVVRALLKARQGENRVVVQRGQLGIQLNSKPAGDQEQVVVQVLPNSPAQAAGVGDGDVLVAVDGRKVTSPPEAAALVARHALGEKVTITLLHDGAEKSLEIALGRPVPVVEGVPYPGAPAAGQPPPAANLVQPEQLYVLSADGKRIALAATEQQLEPLRKEARLRLQAAPGAPAGTATEVAPRVLRVERSDLEKKLDEFGHNVESLQKQVEKLTEEIKSLRAKLNEQQ